MMAALFASGRIVELILGLVVVEAGALVAYRRVTGRGPGGRVLADLTAGGALLLALLLATWGAWWGWLGLCLAVAGVAHGVDLGGRWRRD